MIFFDVMNPGMYPYKTEFAQSPRGQELQPFLHHMHARRLLPSFSARFSQVCQDAWVPLRAVYDACTVYHGLRARIHYLANLSKMCF